MKIFRTILIGLGMALASSMAQAGLVDVSFNTTGSANNWTYDFSVTNNLTGTNDIYFFGVQTPATNIVASPPGWAYAAWDNPWPPSYNNPWCCTMGGITPGQTLSGFEVLDTSTVAMTSINWFAYSYGGNLGNPEFTGTAGNVNNVNVPEPATLALLGFGVAGLGFARRRKQKAA